VPLTNVIIEIHLVLLFTLHNTKNIAYHITEVLIFYADKLMVMGNSKNLCVFIFAILLKSQKFDAREIYMFYSNDNEWYMLFHVMECFLGQHSRGNCPLVIRRKNSWTT